MEIDYAVEDRLDADAFIDVLQRSGLAARRPIGDRQRIATMLRNAPLIVAARNGGGALVGVSRALTDFSYCCYLADLAVDRAWQGRGIGRELIRRTHAAAGGEAVTLLLLSAPAAMTYYPKAGLARLENCFGIVGERHGGAAPGGVAAASEPGRR
jgi:predicted N-acetyltransferase YhbS